MTNVLSEQLIYDTFEKARVNVLSMVEKGRLERTSFSHVVLEVHGRLREICDVEHRGLQEEEIKLILAITKGQVIRLLADLESGYYSPIPFEEQKTNPIHIGGSEDSGVQPL